MKFSLCYALIICLSIKISAQCNNQNNSIVGTYGICENTYNCFQLKLESNGTFRYYIDEYFSGEGIVNGYWEKFDDTLFLDILLPQKPKPIIEQYYVDTVTGKKIILQTTEFDSLPLSNINIIVNDSILLKSDDNGIINEEIFAINKIEIVNLNLISDKVYYFNDNNNNVIKLKIPLSAGTELIYLRPTKWLINNKELIPFELIGGEYQLVDNKSIKKVKRRKVVQELREDF